MRRRHPMVRLLSPACKLAAIAALLLLAPPGTDAQPCYPLIPDCGGWDCMKLPTSLDPVDLSTPIDPAYSAFNTDGGPCGFKFCFRGFTCPCGWLTPLNGVPCDGL